MQFSCLPDRNRREVALQQAGVLVAGGATAGPAWALVIQVPEPSTISLFGAAAVVAVLVYRFRNRK